jgi:hypothetical protein
MTLLCSSPEAQDFALARESVGRMLRVVHIYCKIVFSSCLALHPPPPGRCCGRVGKRHFSDIQREHGIVVSNIRECKVVPKPILWHDLP